LISSGYLCQPCRILTFYKTINILTGKYPATLGGLCQDNSSWKGFVIQQIMRRLGAGRDECFFWATHAGAELDLLVVRGRQWLGFEVKRTSSPRVAPSMKIAMADLKSHRLDVIHAGEETFPLGPDMRAVSLKYIFKDLAPLSVKLHGLETLNRAVFEAHVSNEKWREVSF